MSLHMLLLHPQAGAYLMRVAQHIQDDWNPSKTAQKLPPNPSVNCPKVVANLVLMVVAT